jgi:2-phospho-L-lactate guanylyltransferase
MLTDLLTVLRNSDVEDIWLVTGDKDVVLAVDEFDVRILDEDGAVGYNHAVARGLCAITAGRPVAILPADIPLVTHEEIARLTCPNDASNPIVRIAPDRHGRGTNGLYLSTPDLIAPKFGENSFFNHGVAAGRTGAEVRALNLPNLAIDIDCFVDLELLQKDCNDSATAEFLSTILAPIFRANTSKLGVA